MAQADCTVSNLSIKPLPDLGFGSYKNFPGGLYPNGANNRPPAHLAAGLEIARNQITPLTASGTVDTNNGRIVLLSIGMSNTTAEWGGGFQPLANADPSKNPRLVIVDGAQGGQASTDWTNALSLTWTNVQQSLARAGVTTNQVQIIWMKHARRQPTNAFPVHAQLLQADLELILRDAQRKYPNLKIAYLSSRTRAYVTTLGALNPEPFAYESGYSVRWLIEKQLAGNLNYNASNGPVVAPWLSWGPYLWADGVNPRSDGFTWLCSDLQQSDFTHPSSTGVGKVATELLAFFKTDPTTMSWFLRKTITGLPPTNAPSADRTNGPAPLTVHFSANAGDPDGPIRDYAWTFDDGTFSTSANPVKTFFAPGSYQAHLTVTDTNGNTASGSLTVNVGMTGAMLNSPDYASNHFRCAVSGPSNLNHIVQGSADLTNWFSLQTNRGPFVFTDNTASSFLWRFYRAVSTP